MKEIGLKLKNKREENGVTKEEAASDLKVEISQIESIEEGKKEDFEDVLALKELIKDYAKYLGLDGEELLDEFNEYLFEQTSKISLTDIEEAIKEKEIREKDLKILSPYTVEKNNSKTIWGIVIGLIVLIIICAVIYMVNYNNNKTKMTVDSKVSYKLSYKIGE